MITGAEAMVKCLEAEGITKIFGYPGVAIAPFYDGLYSSKKIEHILVRREDAAGHAASGYARISRKPAVCCTTSGPGATNLLTALATAYSDSIPMIAITGQVASDLLGRDVFQEADITGAAESFVKYSYLVKDANDIPRIFKEAFFIASTGRKGPVLIDVPVDIQQQKLKNKFEYPAQVDIRGYKPKTKPNGQQMKKVITAIKRSRRPLVCVGGGVILGNAEKAVRTFCKTFSIPVVSTMMGVGAIQSSDPLYFGMASLIRDGEPAESEPLKLKTPFREMFSQEQYCAMVEKGKNFIREGDIFQVVLSNRLEAEYEGSLLDAYRVLRTVNPSPYMFYFSGQDVEMTGASPETLVKLKDGVLRTFPLAGTRPRGRTEEEDEALEKDLLSDEKELAEHNMLVDLGRNDIGKIAEIGSVEVESFHKIEKFSHVMHIGSTVRGQLAEGQDALNVIDAILPAGTLSGAPKIRACEIIKELEGCKRGIYGGAVGYIDLAGNLDTCIGIRLAFAKNGKLFVRSGAGIVYDSEPKKEYQECRNKAQAVIDAIETAEGGID